MYSFSVDSLHSLNFHIKYSCIHLPTVAHRQTSSPVPVTSKQFEKEEEELMEEIQLISQEKNGLRDYLNLTLGSKIMRYTLL